MVAVPTTPKPNLLWRSLPWLTSRSLMHDIVASDDEKLLKEWRKSELEELATVNVTGALIAGVVSNGLSWPKIGASPWTVKAVFYAALIFALVSVVAGSQQSILLHRIGGHSQGLPALRRLLEGKAVGGVMRPSKVQLYVWQLPIMLLNVSVLLFLIGLMILIWDLAATRAAWDQDMKIATVVSIAGLYALVNYMIGTFSLYRVNRSLDPEIGRSPPNSTARQGSVTFPPVGAAPVPMTTRSAGNSV